MPDFKNMIKGMEEKEKTETPTQEETEKAGKLADSGFKIGEHRFIGKDNNKANPGFIAYGGNNPDQKLSTKELAKVYDEQQKAKNVDPEQDRLAKLKKDAIAESQATAKKEAPLAKKSQRDLDIEEHNKRIAQINAKAPGMKHEDYKAEIAKEDARFNSVQDKWEDEPTQEEAPLAGGNRLFNEYGIATKEGEKASADFKREKGIKNYYSLTNEQFNELAKEAMQKYGIKDLELAQEFLISNEQSDRDWEKLPKQGSFKEAIKDMDKPERDLGDFNPSEPIDDYQSGAKTHSENEFRIEALNDRGMYDFITKNRDYLYRKANSDPQGAVKDIISRASGNYSIKPENIRKDFVMDVLKSFYEDDEGQIPDFNKPEEFNPSDKIEEFNDYYGAKTASERNFNLMTGNDRGAYDYVTQNRDALAKEAEYDPASVLQKIKWHAQNRNWARELKPDSIRKEYLINVIKGIIED